MRDFPMPKPFRGFAAFRAVRLPLPTDVSKSEKSDLLLKKHSYFEVCGRKSKFVLLRWDIPGENLRIVHSRTGNRQQNR
jgi:hypothetical protein